MSREKKLEALADRIAKLTKERRKLLTKYYYLLTGNETKSSA